MLDGVQQSQTYNNLGIRNVTPLAVEIRRSEITYILNLTYYLVTICLIYSHMGYLQEALGTYNWEFQQPSLRHIHYPQ